MTYTKEELRKIFKVAQQVHVKNKAIDNALDAYLDELSKGQYVCNDFSYIEGFLEGIRAFDRDLAEDISYWLYEVPGMKSPKGKVGSTRYVFKTLERYLDFVMAKNAYPHKL